MGRFDPKKEYHFASPSKYSTFLSCPQLFWIYHLHPRRDEFRSPALSLGNVVDETLNKLFSREVDNRNIDALNAEFELAWLQEKDRPEWAILPREEGLYHQDAQTILHRFFKDYDVTKTPIYTPPFRNWDKNTRFRALIEAPITPDLAIRGWGDRLDQIEGGFEVIDYKTKNGATLRPQPNNLQLRMYALLFDKWIKDKEYPGKVNKVAFLYLTPSKIDKQEFNFSDEDRSDTIKEVVSIRNKIQQYWKDYEESAWPCTCGYCENTLKNMEARADEWAKGINEAAPTQPTVDIPF